MNCSTIDILINKELDDRLTPQEREELHRHLAACPECAASYRAFHRLDSLLRERIGDVEPPADFAASVMAALPKEAPLRQLDAGKPRRKRNRWITMAAIAAGLLLAVALTTWFNPAGQPDLAPTPQVADEQPQEVITPQQPISEPEQQPDEQTPVVADDNPTQSDDNPTDSNPDTGNETTPETTQPDSTTPEAPQTYSDGVPLPRVTTGETIQGQYELYTLGSFQDYDAILPRINDTSVTYYVNADGVYLEYQVPLDGSTAPAFVGETESLPTAATIGNFTDESTAHDYSYISALAPDGSIKAINQGGASAGLYLQDTKAQTEPVSVDSQGGGQLVCWAPDGNKVLFTDSSGNLHLYYLTEELILTLYNDKVGSVSWSADSKTVIFSGYDAATEQYSIFRVSVP